MKLLDPSRLAIQTTFTCQSSMANLQTWNIYKRVPPQTNVKMPRIQNHFGHTWFVYFVLTFVPLLFHFCHILYDSRYGIDCTFVGMHMNMDQKTIVKTTPTTISLVVCNPSMCSYVQPNVVYDYKWLPMQLFFKLDEVWFSFQLGCDYDLFHP
jgi:heme/copper-type cytochrome/quinol oxidase subunit 2